MGEGLKNCSTKHVFLCFLLYFPGIRVGEEKKPRSGSFMKDWQAFLQPRLMEYYLESQIPSSNCVRACVRACVMNTLARSVWSACVSPQCWCPCKQCLRKAALVNSSHGHHKNTTFIFSMSLPGGLSGRRDISMPHTTEYVAVHPAMNQHFSLFCC